jgi:hypothetical protein
LRPSSTGYGGALAPRAHVSGRNTERGVSGIVGTARKGAPLPTLQKNRHAFGFSWSGCSSTACHTFFLVK